mmetsp:Transcript_6045/g.12869  ORF Transcript_6045/g.12869 Transcript_6045/m.12869 type:complete len:338 (+) Transcript_6045:387-1400(+)
MVGRRPITSGEVLRANLVNLAAADHGGLVHHHMMLGLVVVRADGILALENLASLEAGLHRAPGPAHRHHMIVGQVVVVVLGALLVNLESLVRMVVVDGGAHLENLARANQVKVAEEGGLLVHHHGAHPANRASLVVVEDLVGAHLANLESQAVEEDGLVHHHHGARPANPERVDHHGATVVDGEARDRNQRGQNQKGRNRNLPRVDIGLGRIVPPIHGNLVAAAAGRPPPESQANQGLHLVEVDGMERMTMTGQEVEVIQPMMIGHQEGILPLPTTSPANLAMTMIGQEAGKEAILPLASPSLPLLRHIPLVGKMMAGMPTSTTRLTLKAFVKSVTH